MSRIGFDSASKVFRLDKKCGLVVSGLAFLPDNGVQKNISRFIEEFRNQTELENLTIKEISDKLHEFFVEKYSVQGKIR